MMSPPAAAEAEPEAAPAPAREAASPALLAAITPVYEAYFTVQEALADDDLEAFRTAAASLHDAVRAVDGDAPESWAAVRNGFLTSAEHVDHFAALDEARVPFEAWSTAALELEARFGHAGEATHYEAYCPMAFDFEGASWLQRAEEIDNPYFGDMMLRCGEIRRTFEPVGGDR
jgi:Cu(I)/Ag(I) efflux system membrane fusion protein